MNLLSMRIAAAALILAAGCRAVPPQNPSPSPMRAIIGWRLVNRPYKDLGEHRQAGDARIPEASSALVFEPIYADEEEDLDASTLVRLEVVASARASVGEMVTARISITSAEVTDCYLIEIKPTNSWTRIEGPTRLILRGSEVKEIRFTSAVEGRAGIRVSARPCKDDGEEDP